MTVDEARQDVRRTFVNGAVGQAVSGGIWLASAAAGEWVSVRWGVLILVGGGALIFPLTVGMLRLAGRRAALGRDNPMRVLAVQVAFVVPLLVPLAGAATLHRIEWFYPAMMLIVGAHYMPFVFLYGMRAFYVLGGGMLAGGYLVAMGVGPLAGAGWTAGGWATGLAMLGFAAWAAAAFAKRP